MPVLNTVGNTNLMLYMHMAMTLHYRLFCWQKFIKLDMY